MSVRTRAALIALGALAIGLSLPSSSSAQTLLHRYSFTSDAADSVGGANGTLLNGASVAGGAVQLDGTDDYVSLPIGSTISSLTNSTFETWVTWNTFQGPWARIFDFGQDTTSNMFLTARNGRFDAGPAVDTPRFAITNSGSGGEQQDTSASTLPVGSLVYLAVVIDAVADTGKLYVNGVQVAVNTAMTLTPSDLGNTSNNWLGRSQYFDPFFDGSISEFRIYDGALTDTQVRESFAAGPDAVIAPVPEPGSVALLVGMGAVGAGCFRRQRRKSGPKLEELNLQTFAAEERQNIGGTI